MRMKVASNRVVSLEHGSDSVSGQSGNLVFLTPNAVEGEEERDGRGLVIAILLCMTCWAVLGYFLLA